MKKIRQCGRERRPERRDLVRFRPEFFGGPSVACSRLVHEPSPGRRWVDAGRRQMGD